MAPNAIRSSAQASLSIPNTLSSSNVLIAERNNTFGVNYSIPSNEAIVIGSPPKSDKVESTANSTGGPKRSCQIKNVSEVESSQVKNKNNDDKKMVTTTIEPPQSIRKSQRQPKTQYKFSRQTQYEKSRVRYDINLVPLIRKNPEFIQYWRERERGSTNGGTTNKRALHARNCKQADEKVTEKDQQQQQSNDNLRPFCGDETVLWIPSSRDEWEDCISEMTAVCKSAALRRHTTPITKPFYGPLSRDYIRDRVDIDDPLIGYQFRHKTGGWLQGFIMFTNFTNWSHYFKWDSMHEASGVQKAVNGSFKIDADGSLAAELENQERAGDPLAGGVVFPSIAEISLVGGLACGEYLLRMALDEIRARERYQYVVLQATDSSRTFYEKFGFVRVGAISRYGPRVKGRRPVDTLQPALSDVVGYRHWTYAHESEKSLGKHGGPSYMMALCIERPAVEPKNVRNGSFLQTMKKYAVAEKPRVRQLGAATTPISKKSLVLFSPMSNLPAVPEMPSMDHSAQKGSGRKRRRSPVSPPPPASSELSCKMEETPKPVSKKKGTSSKSNYQFMQQRDDLLSPPPPGESLTYQQKQYQSVWLAVPPKVEIPSRRAPRERPPIESIPKRRCSSKPQKALEVTAQAAVADDQESASKEDSKSEKLDQNKENAPGASAKKQKIPPIPKRLPKEQHFFNRVVQLKGSKDANYFYVLHFDMKKMTLEALPMAQDDVLDEKRDGRPKWKAQVDCKSSVVDAYKCEIVPTHMVIKTPLVANERWDVLET
jgi:hypothetical protein